MNAKFAFFSISNSVQAGLVNRPMAKGRRVSLQGPDNMLELIRRNKFVSKIILLVFIVPSFVFFGVQGYDMIGAGNAPAKVKGKPISEQEWENAQREHADTLRQQSGQQFDPAWIESPDFKWIVLERLINEKVIAAEIAALGLTVPDEAVLQKIMEIPGITTADGRLDRERYESALRAQGLSDSMHFSIVRSEMLTQQIAAPLQYGFILPQQVTQHVWDLFEQEREVQIKVFRASDYRRQVSPSLAEKEAYYTQNGSQFTVEEHLSGQLVVLDMQSIESTIRITEEEIKTYYQQNARRFAIPEERRASHILIEARKGAPAAEREAAHDEAQSLLLQLRETPALFEKLAKEYSADPGSAAKGGDLGFFARGKMVKAFDDMVFVLNKGEISDIVETDFGYHIIMLTDIKPSTERPLSAVHATIVDEIRKQLAMRRYTEHAEIFSNTVYEQADSLQPVAEKLKLKVIPFENITRKGPPAQSGAHHPILSNQRFLQAIFSEDAIRSRNNTEAIEIEPQLMIAGRVTTHSPQRVRPFNEVRSDIEQILIAQKSAAMAKAAGQAELTRLSEGGEARGFSPPTRVSRQMINMTGRLDLLPIMQANVDVLPVFVAGADYAEGFVIYRINSVSTPKQPNPQVRQAIQMQVVRSAAQQEMAAYISYLRQKSKVEHLRHPESEERTGG